MHGRNDGQTERKAQVTEQVSIEQKTEEIKQRIALFKLRYKEELEKHEQVHKAVVKTTQSRSQT